MKMLGVLAPDKLLSRVNGQLGSGVGRSGRISDTITLRLEVDPLLDDRFGDHEQEVRREFVAEAVQEKLEREGE